MGITPIVGYGGSIAFTGTLVPATLHFGAWSIEGGTGVIPADTTAGAGQGMDVAGITGYSATIDLIVDDTVDALQKLLPGKIFTTVVFNKSAGVALCTFSNPEAGSATTAGFISGVNIVHSQEGVMSASLSLALNGSPIWA